jgi:hypothetical protein
MHEQPNPAAAHAVREALGVEDGTDSVQVDDGLEQGSFTSIFDFHDLGGPTQQEADEARLASCAPSMSSNAVKEAIADIDAFPLGSQKDVMPNPALATPRRPAAPSRSTKSCTVRAQRTQLMKLQASMEDGALAAQQPSSLPSEMQERFARGSRHEIITYVSHLFSKTAIMMTRCSHCVPDSRRPGSKLVVLHPSEISQRSSSGRTCTTIACVHW